MSALSKIWSLKRKPAETTAQCGTKPTALFETRNPDWPCLDEAGCSAGRLKLCARKSDGKEYVTCDRNEWRDKTTCKITLSMLVPSKDHPHPCQLCLRNVGGSPSIATPTDVKDESGYTGHRFGFLQHERQPSCSCCANRQALRPACRPADHPVVVGCIVYGSLQVELPTEGEWVDYRKGALTEYPFPSPPAPWSSGGRRMYCLLFVARSVTHGGRVRRLSIGSCALSVIVTTGPLIMWWS